MAGRTIPDKSEKRRAPELTLRLKKAKDGPTVLTCVRADGTWTSQRIGPERAYGPLHDLTHYVVETEFGYTEGFLGLVASGWDFGDFERPGTAAELPDEALYAEGLAGQLSILEAGGDTYDAEIFNAGVRAGLAPWRPDARPPEVSAEKLDVLRARLADLWRRWLALAPGETLELVFEPGTPR